MSITIGGTTVGEQDSDLMEGFRRVTPEIPGHVRVLAVVCGMSLLGMKEVRKLDGILNEENRSVVTNHIIVTFFSIELDGETSGVSVTVVGTALTGNSGETSENWGSLANSLKELSSGELSYIVGNFKETVSTSTLSMDNSLGDTLSIEMSKLVNKVEVLKKERSTRSS